MAYGPGDNPNAPKVKPRVVKAAPTNFPKLVPVRPGAPTPKAAAKPSTQAQRTHVHVERVKRNKVLAKAGEPYYASQGKAVETVAEKLAHAQAAHEITTDSGLTFTPTKYVKLDKQVAEARAGGALGKLTGINIKKALDAAPSDALELAVTTPSSIAKLASTAVTHPKKVPGMLAAPYVDLYKHPKQFIESHPVSAALMVSPAARAPGLAAGKVARLAGKQTLARPTATLAATALKETRTGSRDFTIRAMQARRDAKTPEPTITATQMQKRVDATYAAGKTHAQRVEAAAYKQAKKAAKSLPKDQRKAAIQEHVEGARGGARNQADQRFAREFGSTWYVGKIAHPSAPRPGTPEFAAAAERYRKVQGLQDRPGTAGEGAAAGAASERVLRGAHLKAENGRVRPDTVTAVMKPKNAAEGVLHATREEAQLVADKLNKRAPTLQRGTRLYGKEQVPNDFVVKEAGDKYAVIPKVAADRLTKQRAVGTSKATGAKLLRQSRSLFTKAVLPYRPTWLTGQGIEGVVRSAVQGAGPTSYLRARKTISAMEAIKPGSGKALLERAAPGGLVGRTAAHEMTSKTLMGEFPDSTVARALTDVGRAPGIKQVRQLHHAVSSFVFEKVNAKTLEGIPQTMMLGRALKQSPLMERNIIGLSDKAIQDAAKGLQSTENQVQLARAVERAYGKYAGFTPKQRELIMHWTPFLPWYINTAQFLLSVLPKDHPAVAGLTASADAATEEWRKKQGLSTRGGETLPAFMLGGYPTNAGKTIMRLGHYTPFGVGSDVTNAAAALPLPQFKGAYDAVSSGLDWKGHQLKHEDGTPFNQGERWLYGLTQLGESFVPLASQTAAVAGAKDKSAAIRKQFRLLSSTPSNRATSSGPGVVTPVRIKPVRVKPVVVKPVTIR